MFRKTYVALPIKMVFLYIIFITNIRDAVSASQTPQYTDPNLQYADPNLQYFDPNLQYADPNLQYIDIGQTNDAPGSRDEQRIVGGAPGDIRDLPYQVSLTVLTFGGFHLFCGGSLIGAKHVLTAGHCFSEAPKIPITYARLGSEAVYTGGVVIRVESALHHPDFKMDTLDSDVCVLTLADAAPLEGPGGTIRTAILPSAQMVLQAGNLITVSGFGTTKSGGSTSNELLKIRIPVISWQVCHNRYLERNSIPGWEYTVVTKNMFCAGFLDEGRQDSCQGDSGGPAADNGIIYGVVSWGYYCADKYWPGVYAFVPPFTAWIESVMAEPGTNTDDTRNYY